MRCVLVGADFEENLGVGMIAAVLREAGHEVQIVAFDQPGDRDQVCQQIEQHRPEVVGLSVQFQHRAQEFLDLSRQLRRRGFRGHLTVGGQFPTMAWREVIGGGHGVDSVVLHEGERAVVELLEGLERGDRPAEVAGLAVVSDDGVPIRTTPRPLADDLDDHPFPIRYRRHARHLKIPFIPLMGSRGCWGGCSYCSISTFYRDARRGCPGAPPLRLRSPRSVAAEMALLWHGAGGPSIFCFHDDNFLLKRPEASLTRLRQIRGYLDEFGVGKVGLVGKCRPETLTKPLARELAKLGTIRLYLGVENVSAGGAAHLRRRRQAPAVRGALEACREAGIFVCYNLLVFEPWSTIDDVRQNATFISEQPRHPVNFCRAEPYHGTPLFERAQQTQRLGGSYLGWNYRILDDQAELAFRICSAAFRERNFAPAGVANRSMGVGYSLKVAEHFYEPGADGRFQLLRRRADQITADLTGETARFLERALDLAAAAHLPGDADRLERETALLGLAVAEADRRWHAAMDELAADLDSWVARRDRPLASAGPTIKLRQLARGLAVGLTLTLTGATMASCSSAVDPVPEDGGTDADADADVDADADEHVVDPLPEDAGVDADEHVVDPLPEDAGVDADEGRDADMPADPPPRDDPRAALDLDDGATPLVDQWRDTGARRAARSADLPLYDPPEARIEAEPEGEAVRLRLVSSAEPLTIRWQAGGSIEGSGHEVLWRPADAQDSVVVGVRGRGGVAVVTYRDRGRG